MKQKIEKALSDYWESSESEKIAKDVVIVSACRTAIGAFGGSLRDTNAALIGNVALKEAIKRAGIDPQIIDDVRFGCCMEPADACNVIRVSALLAGIPEGTPAVTINRVCISGMEAVLSGMAMIQAGMADVILAGGVEHMSGVLYIVPKARWGCLFLRWAYGAKSSLVIFGGKSIAGNKLLMATTGASFYP